MTSTQSPANQRKISQLRSAWGEILAEALQPGFHGSVAVEIGIQDGTIQHVRRKVEQIER